MAERITTKDTPFDLAQRMLGDGRLTHELMIPGWDGSGPLPVGSYAFMKGEKHGPPSRNWTKPRGN